MIPPGSTRSVAAVFGGSGFIGRYVVNRLAQRGYVVRVAVRDPEAALFLKPMGAVGQVVPLYASLANAATVQRAVEEAQVVVNLVGILAERRRGRFRPHPCRGRRAGGEPLRRGGRVAAGAYLGDRADPASPSLYAASKGRGEAAVRDAFPRHDPAAFARVRDGGPVLQPLRRPVAGPALHAGDPGDARMQPVFVGDVADAVMAVVDRADAQGAVYELGGPKVWSFREILAYILQETHRDGRLVAVPMGLAGLLARSGTAPGQAAHARPAAAPFPRQRGARRECPA